MSDERSGGSQPPAEGGAASASSQNGAAGADTGASDRAGGGDLRSMIAGAVADERKAAETPTRPEPEPKPDPAEPPGGGEEPPPKPGGEPGEEPTAPEEGDDDGPPPLAAKPGRAEAPEHWSAADKAQLAALPEAARAPFLDMYRRMEAGFTPKLQRATQLEKDYGEVDRTFFTPEVRRFLQSMNQSVPQLVAGWAGIERDLHGHNEPLKSQIIARIIRGYGVDINGIVATLNELQGFAPQPQPAVSDRTAPAAPSGGDPVLERRMAALEADAQRQQQERQAAAYRGAGDTITSFANAKDAEGNLKHPHFAELEAEMTSLAQVELNQGRAPVLEDLYDRCLWANQSTRAKHLASQREAEAKKAAEERKAKAEQARRAAASVTGAPGPGQTRATTGDMTLRDQIKANMAGNSTSGGPGRI